MARGHPLTLSLSPSGDRGERDRREIECKGANALMR